MSNNGQNNGLAMVLAFATGFVAGTIISLLYAPGSGRETRQKIRDTTIDARNRTLELAHQATTSAREGVQHLMEQGKENVQGIVDSSKERLHEAGEQVKSAVEAGRKVTADVRSKISESIPGIGNIEEETNEKAAEEA